MQDNDRLPSSGWHKILKIAPLLKFALTLFFVALFVFVIIAAKNFLFPIAFGALFSYLLFPIANFLEKKGIHRIISIILTIIFALMVIAAVFFLFYRQLISMFENYQELRSQVNANIESLQQSLTDFLGTSDNSIEVFLKGQAEQFFGNPPGGLGRIFTATTGTIFRIVILPIYVFLFLYYRTKLAFFILKVVPEESKQITIDILREISTVAARYMGGVTIVVLILCVINSTGLAIIGVEYAILLGIVSAFFNFIPYFGTLMGGLVPFLFVLMTTEQPLYFGLRVAILYMLVQFTENYILTPNIVGGNVRINPMIIIIGLIAGGMVWGIPGMLVIVPFVAILKIIFSHIPRMKPYAYLLGLQGGNKYSISLRRIRHALHFRKKNAPDQPGAGQSD